VWQALGDVKRFLEPFFGSGAVLLARPGWQPGMDEIINDKDCHIANVWRSLQFSPAETARWCDWPVNHVDLTARKAEIIRNEERLRENLVAGPKWHDPVLAGYWIWAASCWIGSGLTRPNAIAIPKLYKDAGVHKMGKRPQLDHAEGVNTNHNIYEWFALLSDRLRYVKVTCGDWKIVLGGNWQDNRGVCGIFLDPPYGEAAKRDPGLYGHDSLTVAGEAARWAVERGKSPRYRIVLAGYYEEHEWLLHEGWSVLRWKANGGYGNRSKGQNNNRQREALFFSPHCNKLTMDLE